MSEHIKNMADSCGQTAENESLATSRDSLKIWADVLNYGKQVLKDAGIAEADLDSWYLFEQIFGISRAQYFMCARDRITDRAAQGKSVPEHSADRVKCGNSSEENPDPLKQKLDAYDAALKKRASHIPLQQIIGQQEFMGLSFFVNEHVLIPRQDTETLVELVLNEQKDRNCSILDMCTGSGCIAKVKIATITIASPCSLKVSTSLPMEIPAYARIGVQSGRSPIFPICSIA